MMTNDREELIVSMTDSNGRVTYVNRAFMKATGFTESGIVGQPHSKLRDTKTPRAVFAMMWDAIRADKEFFCFLRNATASGGAFWSFAAVYPHHRASGQTDGYHATHRLVDSPPAAITDLYEQLTRAESPSSGLNQAMPVITQHTGAKSADDFARFSIDLYLEH